MCACLCLQVIKRKLFEAIRARLPQASVGLKVGSKTPLSFY